MSEYHTQIEQLKDILSGLNIPTKLALLLTMIKVLCILGCQPEIITVGAPPASTPDLPPAATTTAIPAEAIPAEATPTKTHINEASEYITLGIDNNSSVICGVGQNFFKFLVFKNASGIVEIIVQMMLGDETHFTAVDWKIMRQNGLILIPLDNGEFRLEIAGFYHCRDGVKGVVFQALPDDTDQ